MAISTTLANLAVNLAVTGYNKVDTALTAVKNRLAAVAHGGAKPMTAATSVASAFAKLAGAALAAVNPITLIVGAATLAAAALVALAKGLYDCAGAAAKLRDTIVQAEHVLGTATPKVEAMADALGRSAGVDRGQFIKLVQTYTLLAQSAGVAADKSNALGISFAKLAVDASRSLNIPLAEAAKMIEGGLKGESMDVLGVHLSDNAVKARAMSMGLASVNRELSENAAVTARAAIMQEELARLNGTAESEVGGFNEQLAIMSNNFTHVGETIGKMVIPAFTLLLRFINWTQSWFVSLIDLTQSAQEAFGKFIGVFESDEDRETRLKEVDQRRKRFTDKKALEQKLIQDRTGKQTGAKGMSLESFAKSLATAGFGSKKDISQQLLAVQQGQLKVLGQIDNRLGNQNKQPKIAVAK